jgi:glycosyltransferase involved in cell wall biosynthesis
MAAGKIARKRPKKDQKLRILHLNKYYYLKGGCEKVLFSEMDLMKARGHQVAVYASRHPENLQSEYSDDFAEQEDYFDSSFWHKAKAAFKMVYSLEARKKCGKVMDHFKPDVLHAHNIFGQLSSSVLDAAKERGIPVVMTAHDYKLVCPSYLMLNHGQVCEKCFGHHYYQCFLTKCHQDSRIASAVFTAEAYFNFWFKKLDSIKTVICPSEFMRTKMLDRFPENKLAALPNPVSPSPPPSPGQNQGYFLFAGRLSGEKGVRTLIKAFQGLKWPLLIAGTGPLESEYRREAEDSPHIRFTGFQTAKALEDLYRNAYAFILPSEWNETMGLAGMEALAYGKPLVGSRIGGIPELVEDGVNGLLFEPWNATDLRTKVEFLRNLSAGDYVRMCRNARESALPRFSMERHYEGLMEVYQKALAPPA